MTDENPMFRMSKLYDWDELEAELGERISEIDKHRIVSLIDCDDVCACQGDCDCKCADCNPAYDGERECECDPCNAGTSIMMPGFHFVNRAGYYVVDPPWNDATNLDDNDCIPEDNYDTTFLPAAAILDKQGEDAA